MPSRAARQRRTGRSNVSTACTACRSVKVKCDGAIPKCGNCRSKELECHYELGKDKRRLALRKVIEVCSERIQQLESYISSKEIQVPPPLSAESAALLVEVQATTATKETAFGESEKNSPERSSPVSNDPNIAFEQIDQVTSAQHDATIQLGTTNQHGEYDILSSGIQYALPVDEDISTQLPDIDAFMDFQGLEDDNFDWSWTATEESAFLPCLPNIPDLSGQQFAISPPPVPQHESKRNDRNGSSTDESDGGIVEQLSVRIGDLQIVDDGSLRYFGPTSNMTLSPAAPLYNFGQLPMRKTDQNHVRTEDVLSSVQLKQFLNLYFSWQNSAIPLVDQEVFEDDLLAFTSGKDAPFCSEALKFSMSALGAMLESGSRASVPNSMAQTLADNALSLLGADYDLPRITTVQSFAILSCFEGLHTRDTRGWLYAGMAMRLALDLGLHVDTTSFVLAGKMTIKTARARRTAFWGTYLTDQLWSFYLGRPIGAQVYEAPISAPIVERDESEPLWTPYRTSTSNAAKAETSYSSCSRTVFIQSFVALCQEISALASKLYGSIRASNDELVELAEKTFHSMQRWKATLNQQLQFNRLTDQAVPAPHILLLHIQYYVFLIILHRPFVSKRATQPYPLRGEGPFHAREMCITSAVEIAKLLQVYEETYSLTIVATPVVHAAFSAALILVYATISQTSVSGTVDLSGDLATCCRVLSVLGGRFESSARALDTLLAIKRKWQSILVVGTGRKRSSSGRPNEDLIALRKRNRSSYKPNSLHGSVAGSNDGSTPSYVSDAFIQGSTNNFDRPNVTSHSDEMQDERFRGIAMPQ